MTPANAARKYIRECGRLVRDHIPISFRLWKSNNANEQSVAVPQRDKEQLWCELKNNFIFPLESEELVNDWTFRKMATQFQTFKRNLVKDYIKQGKTPTFTGALEKQKDHGMHLWHISVQSLVFSGCKGTKKMHRRKNITTL
jgi:Tfp pilus assembly pilus retraction ATPase PilT